MINLNDPSNVEKVDRLIKNENELEMTWNKSGYHVCQNCNGLVLADDSEWLGEDEAGKGWTETTYTCENCGAWRKEKHPE